MRMNKILILIGGLSWVLEGQAACLREKMVGFVVTKYFLNGEAIACECVTIRDSTEYYHSAFYGASSNNITFKSEKGVPSTAYGYLPEVRTPDWVQKFLEKEINSYRKPRRLVRR